MIYITLQEQTCYWELHQNTSYQATNTQKIEIETETTFPKKEQNNKGQDDKKKHKGKTKIVKVDNIVAKILSRMCATIFKRSKGSFWRGSCNSCTEVVFKISSLILNKLPLHHCVPVWSGGTGNSPGVPATPCSPWGPLSPWGPCSPWGPWGPGGPCAPGSPFNPSSPLSPDGPWGPCGPSAPVLPLSPWGPAGPIGPVWPVGPSAASERTQN